MMIGSLFSGVGGLDLAVEAVTGGAVAWHSEIDPYASHVLAARWPGVPNLGDITEIAKPPGVNVLCGGFPCQDISQAGKGAGLDGKRSGLWWEFHRLIRVVAPAFVFVENVSALRSRGLDTVLGSLAGLGFDAEWASLSAADVGASQRRRRLFVLAYRNRRDLQQLAERQQRLATKRGDSVAVHTGEHLADAVGERGGQGPHVSTGQSDAAGDSAHVADPVHCRREGLGAGELLVERVAAWGDADGRDSSVVFPPSPDDGGGWVRWVRAGRALPGVRRSSYGSSHGVDARRRRGRLRCLGNGVVPRQAAAAFLSLVRRASQ